MSDPTSHPLPLGEIVQGPSAFEQFLDKNQKLIAVSAVAVALGLGGFMVYRTVEKDNAAAAGAAFTTAADIADLEKVKIEYANTPSAVTSALAIANKQWESGQQDEAIATLREITEKFPQHPASIAAQNTLGYRLLAQDKTGDAAAVFQAVVDRNDTKFLAASATIALGDIAKKSGDLDKAKSLYETVSKEYADSPFANIAATRVKFIHFAAPVEVDAPPVVTDPPPLLRQPELAPSELPGTGNPLFDSLNQPSGDSENNTPAPDTTIPAPPTPPSTPEQ